MLSRRGFLRLSAATTALTVVPAVARVLPDRAKTLAVCIDTSGSISRDMFERALAEINDLVFDQTDDYVLNVWNFDTEVRNHQVYTPATISRLRDMHLEGGAGTMIECNFDYIRRRQLRPDHVVLITDGYFNDSPALRRDLATYPTSILVYAECADDWVPYVTKTI